MQVPFLLKVVTETNKRFIISLEITCTTNNLIQEVKKYFKHYYRISYSIKFVYTSDKFVIFDDLLLSTYFNNGDICYIKGSENESIFEEVELKRKVLYDFSAKRIKEGQNRENESKKFTILKKANELKRNTMDFSNKGTSQVFKKIPIIKSSLSKIKIEDKKEPVFLKGEFKLLKNEISKNTKDDEKNTKVDYKNGILKNDISKNTKDDDKNGILKDDEKNGILKDDDKIRILKDDNVENDFDNSKIGKSVTFKDDLHKIEDSLIPKELVFNKEIPSLDSNKKKNNKNERNFNVKNGINPNLILKKKEEEILNKNEQEILKKNEQQILNKNEEESNANSSLKKKEEESKLFVLEGINNKPKEKPVVEIKGIKQVKKRKKINYEEL